MKLSRWQFRVRDALGNLKQVVELEQSLVSSTGLRFEAMPHDTGQCTFQARPDGPALAWGDILEIEAAEASGTPARVYRGEARVVGQPGSRALAQYTLTSLKQRLTETEMPEMSAASMDAGAQLRTVLEVLTATQVWGNAIYYDPAKVPDVGVTVPKLTSTNFQILSAYLDELTSYVNGKMPDQIPVVYGVDKDGYLGWGRNPGATLDLTDRADIVKAEWGSIVCEAPCTAVRWFLKPFQALGAATVLSKHPDAASLGTRVTRQTLNALDIWESVTDLNTAPPSTAYTWANMSPEDRQKLQDGTASVQTTFDPERNEFTNLFSITPESPWIYARFTGSVTSPGSSVEFTIVPYDGGTSTTMQTAFLAAGDFDVILPARKDMRPGATGVRSNINFITKTGSTEPITITFSRAGYYAPDEEALDYLATAFYQLPDALIGSVELFTLQPDPPRQVTVRGPLGTLQTGTVTTEYLISAGQYGHTVYKIGDPDPANVRATRQLNDLRLREASAQALAALSHS